MKRLLSLLLSLCLVIGAQMPALAFTDSTRREVNLPSSIDRVAPSSPISQMVLFALCPEKLVGVSTKWPEGAEAFIAPSYLSLPVLGQLYSTGDLNLEELAKRDPQVVIDIGESKKNAAADLDALTATIGIPAVHIEGRLPGMAETYRTLGRLLSEEARAETLARYLERVYQRTEAILTALEESETPKRTLLYCLGENGLNVVAKGAFHAEVFDRLGENAAVVDVISGKGTGNEVDMEQLYLWDPEVILFQKGSVYASVKDDPAWSKLSAIQNGLYVEVPSGPYNWLGFQPSINRYLGLIWLSELLYPEMTEYDLYEEVAEFYSLFYHCTLTREMFDTLTARANFQ